MITALLLDATFVLSFAEQHQVAGSRILRRVVRKSVPNSSSRIFSARFADDNAFGIDVSHLESHNFGKRATVEASSAPEQQASVKAPKPEQTTSKPTTTTTSSTTTSTTSKPTTSSTTQALTTTAAAKTVAPKSEKEASSAHESDRLETSNANVELMSSAPSWQVMTAVAAPTGERIALESSIEEADVLRSAPASSATKGGALKQKPAFFQAQFQQQQQQTRKTSQQVSKTSNYEQTKTWYRPTTTTTQRPEPIIQQQYEQQRVEQQVVESAPLGQAEPFAFDFKTDDNNGNGQYRKEESDKDGVVRGSYGYTDSNGIYRHVQYIADRDGFRANIKSNEPGMDGETQPADIQLAAVESPKSRLTGPRNLKPTSEQNSDWTSSSNNNNRNDEAAELGALIDPNFESSHKPERVVSDRLRQL